LPGTGNSGAGGVAPSAILIIVEQYPADVREAPGPVGFVVCCAHVDEEMHFVFAVAEASQVGVEIVGDRGVVHVDAAHGDAFFGAHVEVDFCPDVLFFVPVAESSKIGPHDAWGDGADASDDVGAFPAAEECHEAAEGGSDEGGVFRAGERAVAAVDVGDEEFREVVEEFSPHRVVDGCFRVHPGGVLGEAIREVVDGADDPFALEFAAGAQAMQRSIDAPGVKACASGVGENVLSVGHVDDGVVLAGLVFVGIGRVDPKCAIDFVQRGVKIINNVYVSHGQSVAERKRLGDPPVGRGSGGARL